MCTLYQDLAAGTEPSSSAADETMMPFTNFCLKKWRRQRLRSERKRLLKSISMNKKIPGHTAHGFRISEMNKNNISSQCLKQETASIDPNKTSSRKNLRLEANNARMIIPSHVSTLMITIVPPLH